MVMHHHTGQHKTLGRLASTSPDRVYRNTLKERSDITLIIKK